MILPAEILNLVGSYFGNSTTLKLILGIEVDKYQAFHEGGYSIILEDILSNYPDKFALTNIKKYLPNKDIALVKANLTKNVNTLKLVAEIWKSSYSNYAYVHAVGAKFLEGIHFIGHDIPSVSQQLLNQIIIDNNLDGEVDLTVDNPLEHVTSNIKYLSELNRDELLNTYQLEKVYYYRKDVDNLRKVQEQKPSSFIGTEMITKVAGLYLEQDKVEEAISWIISQGCDEYGDLCASNVAYKLRDVRVLQGLRERLMLEHREFNIHSAFMTNNIRQIEEYYGEDDEEIITIGSENYPDVLASCLSIRHELPDNLYSEEVDPTVVDSDINEWVNTYNPEIQLQQIRTFVKTFGMKHLNKITKKINLFGKDDITWFCSIISFPEYKLMQVDNLSGHPYLLNKVVYYPKLSLSIHRDENSRYYYISIENCNSLDLAINCDTLIKLTTKYHI